MLTFLGACKKVSRRQAKPPAAATEATDIHPEPQEPGRPKGRQEAAKRPKKRATEVAQNALRAHQTQKDLLLALIRILPDKKSKPCKKQNHEPNGQNPGKHHVIEKHDCGLPAPALLRWS